MLMRWYKQWEELLDEPLGWAHEIWHVWAARLVGVPEWAITCSATRIEIPYRIGRWRFAIILLAPFTVFFSTTVALIVGWVYLVSVVDIPAMARDAVSLAATGKIASSLQSLIIWIGLQGIWLLMIAFGLLYLHTCLYDLFRGLPVTLRRYNELKSFPEE